MCVCVCLCVDMCLFLCVCVCVCTRVNTPALMVNVSLWVGHALMSDPTDDTKLLTKPYQPLYIPFNP